MNKRLALYIFSGLVLGAVTGLVFPSFGVGIKPLGDIFLNLIKMVIIPLVFSSLVVGASGIADVKRLPWPSGKRSSIAASSRSTSAL